HLFMAWALSSIRHLLFLCTLAFLSIPGTQALIFFSSGDPSYHTDAPTGSAQKAGWDLQGNWIGFLGTPIAPHYFIAAKHIGGSVGTTFAFGGKAYTTTAVFVDTVGDLQIWRVAETFPSYAQLYSRADEVGKPTMMFGRGTQRGAAVTANGTLK